MSDIVLVGLTFVSNQLLSIINRQVPSLPMFEPVSAKKVQKRNARSSELLTDLLRNDSGRQLF